MTKEGGEGGEGGSLWNAGCMAVNVVSSVSIALILKALFLSNTAVPVTGLVVFHMFCAMVLTHTLHWRGWFVVPDVDWGFISVYSLVQGMAIVCSNINLQYNSIGVYQMSKLAVIPVMVFTETVLKWREVPSLQIGVSLFIVMIGVGLATVHDVTVTMVGLFWASLAVFSIASVQIMGGRQKQQSLSPLQLLHISTGPTALMLSIATPYMDNLPLFYAHGLTNYELFLIVLSGVVSVAINFTVLAIIGDTSPVTYQVLGHLKSVSLLIVGTLMFKSPISPLQFFGICLALIGTARYGQLKVGKPSK
jgi:solute carrier family 35 protein E3